MHLKKYEKDCLRRVAAQSSGAAAPCSAAILQHLIASGLIEKRSSPSLPIEMSHQYYIITPLGSQLLQQSDAEQ